MSVFRLVDNQRKPSLPVDEHTLYHLIREGKVNAQTILHYDGQALPAEQIPAIAPMFRQASKPLAPYLQPSKAGFVATDVSVPSRLNDTQIVGIVMGIGCLILLFFSLSMINTRTPHGRWQNIPVFGGVRHAHGASTPRVSATLRDTNPTTNKHVR